MKKFNSLLFVFSGCILISGCCCASDAIKQSATDVVTDIYNTCLSKYSVNCVKPKALAWISEAVKYDEIKINDDLTILKTGGGDNDEPIDFTKERNGGDARIELFDKIDSFLATHSLRLNFPQILQTEEARAYLPTAVGFTDSLEIPLAERNVAEGIYIYNTHLYIYLF